MVHPIRKRKASDKLQDINDLPRPNKQPRCGTPTSQTRASAPQPKASTSSPGAHPVAATTPHRPEKSQSLAHVFPLNAPPLPPRTSKQLPTDMGQQLFEQDQQKVKEKRCVIHGVSEEVQAVDQGPENDRLDIGKPQNGKLCQNIDKSDKNPFEYLSVDKSKVVHYKVPLKRLPRMHNLQGFVGTLKNYCEGIENKLGLSNMEDTGMGHREDIDIFIQDNTFDMSLLIEDHEDLDYTNTEIYQIASRKHDVAGSKAVGVFVNSEGIQFVESVTDNEIVVYSDSRIKNEEEDANAIRSLMEVIIMRPLIRKIALFHRLRSIAHSEEISKVFSAASFSWITENEATGSDVFYQCIQQNKSNIERLLDEMIALSKRSNLPEEIKPVFEEYQTTIVTEEVARDLFKLDNAITWCGFRYRTFNIYVNHTSNESEEKVLEEKISTFLTTHGIVKYELIYIQGDLEEYSYIGSLISPKIQKAKEAPSKAQGKVQGKVQGGAQEKTQDHHATLGCFATFKNSNSSSICALISKHFAKYAGNEIFDRDNRLLGKVIPETRDDGYYDIAAAETVDKRVLNLDTFFRNYKGEVKRASLIEKMDNLQGKSVYLRGAKTQLGVGTIEIPVLLKSNGKHHIKVRPGSFKLGNPHARLAIKGDSGAILCYDDDDQNIRVCSMLIGKFGEEESFCFLPLSHGLEELSKLTNGEFKLITHMENSPAQIYAEGDSLQASGSCKYLT